VARDETTKPDPAPKPKRKPRTPAKAVPSDARPSLTRVQAQRRAAQVKRQQAFLAEFGKRALVASSARAAGIHPDTVYEWKRSDAEFLAAFEHLDALVTEEAEAEAWRRGVTGWDEPLAHNGILTGDSVRKFDSSLLTVILKARAPEKYRERYDLAHSVAPTPSGEDARLMALLSDPAKRAAAGAVFDDLA
jgi:hypothetical protein